MTAVAIVLSSNYGYVLIAAAILAFEVILIGGLLPGRLRRRFFNERFMKEKFSEIHAAELKEEIGVGGYPDMGNGRYSQLLSYAEWYEFNTAQRAHLNFVECIATLLALVLIGGVYYPLVQVGFAVVLIISRLIYAVGYASGGPKGRLIGAILSNVGLFGSFSLSITTGIKMCQGIIPATASQ